ncbi:SMAD/FHA domain-containing protein, partial [Dimargaris cristalligena]
VKPNFGLSGKLAAETNTVNGTIVDYNEPPEARVPTAKWRLYVFKGDQQLEVIPVARQSAYLVGRDRKVADLPVDHPSCSKQHAALQYRQVALPRKPADTAAFDADTSNTPPPFVVKPYLIDLASSNGTYVNGERLPATRYYELRAQDVIKFGFSTREYVLIQE